MHPRHGIETSGSSFEQCPWHRAFNFEARAVNLRALAGNSDSATELADAERGLAAVLHGLAPGERIAFTYMGGAGGPLGLSFCGEISPASPEYGEAGGERLAARVASCLLPLEEYFQLSPVESAVGVLPESPPIAPPGCWGRMSPPIGFSAERPPVAGGIWLPAWTSTPPVGFSSLDRLMRAQRNAVVVRVAVERIEISAAARRALSRFTAQSGPASRGVGASAMSLAAGVWTEAPSGLRVQVWAGSAEGGAEGLREGVCNMLFGPAPPFGEPYGDEPVALDLRGCVPWGLPLPRLLPPPAALLGAGKRRVFSPSPPQVVDAGGRLGLTHTGARPLPVRIEPAARCRHVYAIGATGTGKSTMLAHMIRQDIESGSGVCVVDPHGDLVAEVLRTYPEHRAQDLVLVAAGDTRRAAGFNLLECGKGDRETQINFAVSEFLGIFRSLYHADFIGPVFELYLRNALLLLMDNDLPPHTLMDLPRVFEDRVFRTALITWCRNPWVRNFWNKTAEHTSGDQSIANVTAYITSKVNAFLYSPTLRTMVGQPRSTIDFDDVLAAGRVVLLNLAKGDLGEVDTRLLGMTLLSRLFGAALARGSQPSGSRTPFQLYVDEFHQFHTPSFAAMMSESRKFGLGITIAHQNLRQLSSLTGNGDLIESVLGNAGNLLMFRVGAPDAEKLATYTQPEVSPQTLQYLPDYHVVARLLHAGNPTRPFVFETDPPPLDTPPEHLHCTLRASRDRYTRSRRQVDRDMTRRHSQTLTPRKGEKPTDQVCK